MQHALRLAEVPGIPTSIRVVVLPLRALRGRLEILFAPRSGELIGGSPHPEETLHAAAARLGAEHVEGTGAVIPLRVSGSPRVGLVAEFVWLVRPRAGLRHGAVPRVRLADADAETLGAALLQLERDVEHDAGFMLVADEFTVSELRLAHEAIVGVPIDPSNFRKRVTRWVGDGVVEEMASRRPTATRPARVYRRLRAN